MINKYFQRLKSLYINRNHVSSAKIFSLFTKQAFFSYTQFIYLIQLISNFIFSYFMINRGKYMLFSRLQPKSIPFNQIIKCEIAQKMARLKLYLLHIKFSIWRDILNIFHKIFFIKSSNMRILNLSDKRIPFNRFNFKEINSLP